MILTLLGTVGINLKFRRYEDHERVERINNFKESFTPLPIPERFFDTSFQVGHICKIRTFNCGPCPEDFGDLIVNLVLNFRILGQVIQDECECVGGLENQRDVFNKVCQGMLIISKIYLLYQYQL